MARLKWFAAAVSLALVVLATVACEDKDKPDAPVSATPGGTVTQGQSALHAVRMDAAKHANVEPLAVKLTSLRHAGWDSCLGYITKPDQPCRELFVGGYIARFTAGGKEWRYHIGGGSWVGPVDPAKGRVDDGSQVPPELRADFTSVLAGYVRAELEQLRTKDTGGKVTAVVTAIVPAGFSSSCLGFERSPGEACTSDLAPGAVVLLAASNGKTYRYHVAQSGVIATDFEQGKVTMEPDANDISLQERMRKDLATRLNQPLESISMVAFRHVTWPDGCLGIQLPGKMCTQALVPGFYAEVADKDGKVYRYHASRTGFVNATLEPGAVLGPPPPAATP